MAAPTGFIDHTVDDIEIAPAALLVVRAAAHQTVARLRGTLLGKIVFQQLHHGRQPLANLSVRQVLRAADQLAGKKIKLAGGNFDVRDVGDRTVADAPHKTRIAQAQHRHQADQVMRQVVDIIKLKRPTPPIKEAAQRHDAIVFRKLPFQTVKNTLVTIITRYPAVRQWTITPHPMTARLQLAESQNNMQMMFPTLHISRWKPEVIAHKMIELFFR
ncbi:hypothetical protein HMPREF0880_02828 [Yokenella regensburgei ATCC 43003]|nr:hypothetical protein HMPREF0880_02828 [Yokenella regensburgei ATCC 43003]